MHDKQDILNKVIKHLEKITETETETETEIKSETNIAEQFALDSVKVLDLVMEIEDEFDISVPMNLMADVQTVGDLVDVIYKIESE